MSSDAFQKRRKQITELSDEAQRLIARYLSVSNKYSAARLVSFITGAAVTIYAFSASGTAGWISLTLSLLLFGIIVHYHNKLLHGIRRLRYYSAIHGKNLARMDIDWEALPGYYDEAAEIPDPIERDLDLYGSRSLHCLIDNTISFEGSELLRKFLHGDQVSYEEVGRRQELVKLLSSETRLRNRFLLRANLASSRRLNCTSMKAAFTKDLTYRAPVTAIVISFILLFLFVITTMLSVADLYSGPVVIFLILSLFNYFAFAGKTGKSLETLSGIEAHISKLHSVLSVLSDSGNRKKGLLSENFPSLFNKGSVLNTGLARLKRLSEAAAYRENSIFRTVINIIIPYDFILQRRFADAAVTIRDGLDGHLNELNEFECLSAIANFAWLNPDYSFSRCIAGAEFDVRGMVHPLMKREYRRPNDFSMNEGGEIVIITGSNMSGKSTFLRTAGINLCLAYAGAPSACSSLFTQCYRIFTCIKVTDSVFDGISYFYAEVKRLKELIDLLGRPDNMKVMFFVDEIFKGTNNKERLSGSMSFLKSIAGQNCTGFVTTHDLELASLAEALPSARNFHFREEIRNGIMSFDYTIRPGPCPTTNALEIMRINGLPVEE